MWIQNLNYTQTLIIDYSQRNNIHISIILIPSQEHKHLKLHLLNFMKIKVIHNNKNNNAKRIEQLCIHQNQNKITVIKFKI